MAATFRECDQCGDLTRRRCRDCREPVCQGCHVHGQCENCVDGNTFNQTAANSRNISFSHYVGACQRQYHGRREDDVA